MLNKVKLALRINNTAYDSEIEGLISACKRELELAGIASSNIKDTDSMIIQAVTLYCKAYFGLGNSDSEKYMKAYEHLKSFLSLTYNEEIVPVNVSETDEQTETTSNEVE